MTPNRILFVDDEPGILEGLRNSLRRERRRWEMVFVSSGAQALREMAAAPFDLVVTDMRMPQMDGAELLARVKAEHPATARIVLSGHAERDAVLRALPVAHQYLSKPCDPEHLRRVIERTCRLNALLHQDAVRRVIGSLERLPSVPRTYLELTRAMTSADVDLHEVVAIVERDTAMAVKVLQLVNSAYFGIGQPVSSIREAVGCLGLELLKSLVLTAHIFATIDAASLRGLCLERLQEHSMLMAPVIRRYVGDGPAAEAAFTAALVHDAGEIVLALGFGERFDQICSIVERTGRPCHAVEEELLGVSHAEVGAYLLGIWGLPLPIVEAVAYHHHPGRLAESGEDSRLVAALHVADALLSRPRHATAAADAELDLAFLQRGGFAGELERWRAIAAEEVARTGS